MDGELCFAGTIINFRVCWQEARVGRAEWVQLSYQLYIFDRGLSLSVVVSQQVNLKP